MADLTEEEAVLHLKRALGELDAGDAVPRALAPVSLPPPRPKVQKTMQAHVAKAAPMVGPSPPPSGGVSIPAKQPTWAEIRVQQEAEHKHQQQQREIQKLLGQQQSAAQAAVKQSQQQQPPSFGLPDPSSAMPGHPGMSGMQSLKPPGGQSGGAMPPGLSGPPGGMQGMPPFPGMPGMPPMPMPSPAAAAASEKNSVAAQVAAAMQQPGMAQAHVDIPQAKVGMVIGKNGATLNAIKAYAKAQCFVEQRTPDEDLARITIVGKPNQVEKCKQTTNALVDGTMSAATLFQLAGIPLPSGGAGEASASDRDRLGGGTVAAVSPFPGGMPPGMQFPGGMPPGMPPGMQFPGGMPPMPQMGGTTIHGLPENQQMQTNLNDYYARWWATYANDNNPNKGPKLDGMPEGPAFDKQALLKLAARAADPEPAWAPPLPPGPSPDAAPHITHRGVPISSLPHRSEFPPAPDDARDALPYQNMASPSSMADLAERASFEVRALLGGSAPSGGDSSAYDPEATPGPAVSSTARQPAGMGFKPVKLQNSLEPSKAKKDDDSVQKMLERLQGNVEQNKQAKKEGEEFPQAAPVRMQIGGKGRGGQDAGSLAQMMQAGGPHAAFREETRTRADVEFEAVLNKLISQPEDVDNLGREVLIRFPTFSPQQITELLQKIDSNAGLQNGDFQAELSRVLIPRLKEFTSSQFTTLTSTFASWSNDARGNKKKGRFSEFSKAFFMAASAEMTSRLMEYAPHEINCCLAAFVSVGFSEHKFFASVGRAALARHSSFAPVQLTALLAILSEMRLVHVDLFNASAQFLSMRAKELRPVDVIRVLRSFSKCSVHHHGMCRAIGDEVVSRIRAKSSNFKVEDLCEIAYSFCVLSFYHDEMFRMLFKELEKSPMVSIDALIQLYECHLTLDCEHKEAYASYRMDSDLAHALQEHYREHRKDERRCSERQRNDVASVLKSLVDGSVHVNHRTSSGLLVDVAALRKRSSADGFIHIDLDSTVTVVRSLDQEEASPSSTITEGPVALRRRILAKHGLRLVTVKESEWRELDDSKDKRRHLRSLLSSLGDVLEK